MTKTHQAFPIHVRTPWLDYSPALHAHTRARIDEALAANAPRIQSVTARIVGGETSRDERACEVEVIVRPAGIVIASARAADAYSAADLAARRARNLVRRHLARQREQLRRAA